MFRSICLLVAVSFSSACFSQYGIEKLEVPVQGTYNDVCFVDRDTGYITGSKATNDGFILKTTDGGESWTEMTLLPAGTVTTVKDIQFVQNGIGYAFAKSATNRLILKTVDYGQTWNSVILNVSLDVVDFHFYNADLGYAATLEQDIYKISAGGTTCTALDLRHNGQPIMAGAGAVFAKDIDTLFALYYDGYVPMVFRITNETNTEQLGGILYNYLFYSDIFFSSPSTGYIAGDEVVLKTSNGGYAFEECPVSKKKEEYYSSFNEIQMYNDEIGVLTGSYETGGAYEMSRIICTRDGGANWEELDFYKAMRINGASYPDASVFYVAGDTASYGGAVYKFEHLEEDYLFVSMPEMLAKTCADTILFQPDIIYNGDNSLSYRWSPDIGLSSGMVRNPSCFQESDITYSLFVSDGKLSDYCEFTLQVLPGANPRISYVTFNSRENVNEIHVIDDADEEAATAYYFYYSEQGTDSLVAVIDHGPCLLFRDTVSARIDSVASYKIMREDKCGLLSGLSEVHSTIYLQLEASSDTVYLSWTPYAGMYVSGYTIYKATGNEWHVLAEGNNMTLHFADANPVQGTNKYRVAARLENSGSCNGQNAYNYSFSNEASVQYMPPKPHFSLTWTFAPQPQIIDCKDTVMVCENEQIRLDTLYTVLLGDPGNPSWWILENNNLERIESAEIKVVNDAVLYLDYYQDGCLRTDSVQLFIMTDCNVGSITNLFNSAEIQVYPNPANDLLRLTIKGVPDGQYTFRLMNTLSQEVYSESFYVASPYERTTLPGVAPGFYMGVLCFGEIPVKHFPIVYKLPNP